MEKTRKIPCSFMLDPDVAAAIDAAVAGKRISKSAFVNQLLADVLLGTQPDKPSKGKKADK